jgi:hypothetical protein
VDDVRLVGHGKCPGDLNRHVDRLLDGESIAHRGSKGAPLDEFHGKEPDAVVFVQSVNRGDVGMVERREQLSLALKAGKLLGVLLEGVGKNLDRHLSVKRGIKCLPHYAHPAFADLLDESVVPQRLAGLHRHGALLPGVVGQWSVAPIRGSRKPSYPGVGNRVRLCAEMTVWYHPITQHSERE